MKNVITVIEKIINNGEFYILTIKSDATLDYKNGHLSRYGIPSSFYEYMKK